MAGAVIDNLCVLYTEGASKRLQAEQLDAKLEQQVHQLAKSFNVDLASLEGAALHLCTCTLRQHARLKISRLTAVRHRGIKTYEAAAAPQLLAA